jgi:hypothetical protein
MKMQKPDLIARRDVLVLLGALVARPWRSSLAGQAVLRVRTLNHFGIAVSDPQRSIDFYQGLFGMPIQARTGTTTALRVGSGPQFLSIRPLEGDAAPSITHFGLGIDGFNIDRAIAALAARGASREQMRSDH